MSAPHASRLAILGGSPAFEHSLPIGQLYFPDWSDYEAAMRGIFQRHYYTNQGPLACELESALEEYLGVRHAICVTNATIGLMMAAEALELQGPVITPAFSFVATSQSLSWAGLSPLFCDVCPEDHQLDPERVIALLQQHKAGALLAVNLWGDVCQHEALQRIADTHGIPLYFDSAHAFGCRVGARAVGNLGALEIFSFHATKVLSAAEGGCICTNDDRLASRLRNIRSSYGAGAPVAVRRTSNGRMSEAQAAMGLLSLQALPAILARNQTIFSAYEAGLAGVPGVHLLRPQSVTQTNYQYVVCEIEASRFGLTRDQLQQVLQAERVLARRYFYPGIHRCPPYDQLFPSAARDLPVTEALNARVLQLPIGQLVDGPAVELICAILKEAHRQAERIRYQLERVA